MDYKKIAFIGGLGICLLNLVLTGCGKTEAGSNGQLVGKVAIDGSSTVFPITEAVAEEFLAVQPKIRVTVGVSGTGGGFKKFLLGETDINDASRTIKSSEAEKAEAAGIGYIELPVAYDGISVLVNPSNTFVDYLTVAELKKIWEPGSKVTMWSQVRDGFPEEPITLYGPGTDSGTFDYFTKAINGKEQACRADFTASEDDNVLVTGIAGDTHALGFFGYAYYEENRDKLRAVPIKLTDAAPAIAPSMKTINDGSYAPLSRPIFIYVSTVAAERPEVEAFVQFYLKNAATLSQEVGYVALPDSIYKLATKRYNDRVSGSVFAQPNVEGLSLEQLMEIGR